MAKETITEPRIRFTCNNCGKKVIKKGETIPEGWKNGAYEGGYYTYHSEESLHFCPTCIDGAEQTIENEGLKHTPAIYLLTYPFVKNLRFRYHWDEVTHYVVNKKGKWQRQKIKGEWDLEPPSIYRTGW